LDDEVIALFPTLPGTYDPTTCLSYMHVGQHGAAAVSLVVRTRLARRAEYLPLRRELEAAPYRYRLKLARRFTKAHVAARKAAIGP
jgi:hypothetical protein